MTKYADEKGEIYMFSKSTLQKVRNGIFKRKILQVEIENQLLERMKVNQVTTEEAKIIWQGSCPCGAEQSLLKGPRGGLSINVKCEECGQSFNIPPMPWLPEKLN